MATGAAGAGIGGAGSSTGGGGGTTNGEGGIGGGGGAAVGGAGVAGGALLFQGIESLLGGSPFASAANAADLARPTEDVTINNYGSDPQEATPVDNPDPSGSNIDPNDPSLDAVPVNDPGLDDDSFGGGDGFQDV